MKIRLTEDITRYDDKMRLRFDLVTLGKTVLSIGVCLLILALLTLLGFGFTLSFTAAITIGVALFALLASRIDGKCALIYVCSMLAQFIIPTACRRSYTHEDTIENGFCRISISKEDTDEEKRQNKRQKER